MSVGAVHPAHDTASPRRLARLILATFVLTFIAARVLVILIMTRRIPDLFLHLGGTHVHHLNYGIFLLSGVGAYLLLVRPTGRAVSLSAALYAVGLALTFDEFGMWIHLGGSYWQRASYDAVVVIAAIFGLVAVGPSIRAYRPKHWSLSIVIAAAAALLGVLLIDSLSHAERITEPKLMEMEQAGPK